MNWPVVENDKMTYDLSSEKGLLGTHADIMEALAEYAGIFTYATVIPSHKINQSHKSHAMWFSKKKIAGCIPVTAMKKL